MHITVEKRRRKYLQANAQPFVISEPGEQLKRTTLHRMRRILCGTVNTTRRETRERHPKKLIINPRNLSRQFANAPKMPQMKTRERGVHSPWRLNLPPHRFTGLERHDNPGPSSSTPEPPPPESAHPQSPLDPRPIPLTTNNRFSSASLLRNTGRRIVRQTAVVGWPSRVCGPCWMSKRPQDGGLRALRLGDAGRVSWPASRVGLGLTGGRTPRAVLAGWRCSGWIRPVRRRFRWRESGRRPRES